MDAEEEEEKGHHRESLLPPDSLPRARRRRSGRRRRRRGRRSHGVVAPLGFGSSPLLLDLTSPTQQQLKAKALLAAAGGPSLLLEHFLFLIDGWMQSCVDGSRAEQSRSTSVSTPQDGWFPRRFCLRQQWSRKNEHCYFSKREGNDPDDRYSFRFVKRNMCPVNACSGC